MMDGDGAAETSVRQFPLTRGSKLWPIRARTSSIVVVALVVALFGAVGFGIWSSERRQVVSIGGGVGLVGDRTLTMSLDVCHGNPVATVRESPSEVRIKVVASRASEDKCRDGLTVSLAAPLGSRRVIDAKSGHEVPVGSVRP